MDQDNQKENDGYKLVPVCYWKDNKVELIKSSTDKQKVPQVDQNLVVRFIVGPEKTEIEGNKIMLEGYSPMLKAKYSGIWSAMESGDKNQVINLPEVDPDSFTMFLQVLNVNPLNRPILVGLECTIDQALHLLNLSKMYMVPHIQEGCRDYLLTANCEDPYSLALIYESLKDTDEEQLKEAAYSELLKNFGLLILNDTALGELSDETWIQILIQSASIDGNRNYPLCIIDEKEILKALVRWGMLKLDVDENLVDHVSKILPHILLNKISDTDLHDILFFIPEEDVHQIKQQQLEVINAREERVRKEEEEKLHREEQFRQEEEEEENSSRKEEKWKFSLLKYMCDDYKRNRQQRVKSGFVSAQTVTGENNPIKMTTILSDTVIKIRGQDSVFQSFRPYLKLEMNWISVPSVSEYYCKSVENKKDLVIDLPDLDQNLLEKLEKVLADDDLTWNYFAAQNFTKIEVLDILCLSRIYFEENVTAACVDFFKNNSDPVNEAAFFVHVSEFLKTINIFNVEWAFEFVTRNFARFLSNDSALGELSKETWMKVLYDTILDPKHRKGDLSDVGEVAICRGLLRWGEIQCEKDASEPSTENVLKVVRDVLPFVLVGRIAAADLMGLEDPIQKLVEYAKRFR